MASAVARQHEASGLLTFKIWPDEPSRTEYNAIIYLQPDSTRNRGAIGYDMGTDQTRRQAMEAARDSGKPFASGRVHLVQERFLPEEKKQPGFLIYVAGLSKERAH